MGREIKRVALDYEFTINKVWPGYLNPHFRKCPKCDHGVTTAHLRLQDLVSLLMLSGEDSRHGRAHPYFYDAPFHNTAGRVAPSVDMAELTVGLAGRDMGSLGHDSLDKWRAVKKIITAAGLSENWGICPHCKGDATDPEIKEVYEAWTKTEPPEGEGWQLWETVTEGSPQTPVFATPEELARYCADNRVSSSGSETESYKTWLKFITGPGWAPSAISRNGEFKSGVAAVVEDD